MEKPTDPRVPLLMPADMLAALDEWRASQRPIPSRGEAIRHAVSLLLASQKELKP